jgi:hypothetical protein
MLTPVFHPNFDESSVCIGDFWAASESLDDLIIRIGRMIAYQEYNTRSPLNGLAAKWAAQNNHLLPIDPRGIAPPSQSGGETDDCGTNTAVPPAGPDSGLFPSDSSPVSQPTPAIPSVDPWSEKICIRA